MFTDIRVFGIFKMGQSHSALSNEELEEYEYCTFFNRKEILHVHQRFIQLKKEEGSSIVPLKNMLELAEIQNNPFRERICTVFSQDETGDLTFEDFLDMMSVFSENATRDVKASYAFRIYDYDNDGYLGRDDLIETVRALCGEENLTASEMAQVADKILTEADLDGDGRLSYVEFDNVIARAPDFVSTFRIRI